MFAFMWLPIALQAGASIADYIASRKRAKAAERDYQRKLKMLEAVNQERKLSEGEILGRARSDISGTPTYSDKRLAETFRANILRTRAVDLARRRQNLARQFAQRGYDVGNPRLQRALRILDEQMGQQRFTADIGYQDRLHNILENRIARGQRALAAVGQLRANRLASFQNARMSMPKPVDTSLPELFSGILGAGSDIAAQYAATKASNERMDKLFKALGLPSGNGPNPITSEPGNNRLAGYSGVGTGSSFSQSYRNGLSQMNDMSDRRIKDLLNLRRVTRRGITPSLYYK